MLTTGSRRACPSEGSRDQPRPRALPRALVCTAQLDALPPPGIPGPGSSGVSWTLHLAAVPHCSACPSPPPPACPLPGVRTVTRVDFRSGVSRAPAALHQGGTRLEGRSSLPAGADYLGSARALPGVSLPGFWWEHHSRASTIRTPGPTHQRPGAEVCGGDSRGDTQPRGEDTAQLCIRLS